MTVAIGIGVMVIVSIAIIKNSLLSALGDRIPTNAPSFFFIDIQPDQRDTFESVLQQWVDPVRLSTDTGRPISSFSD